MERQKYLTKKGIKAREVKEYYTFVVLDNISVYTKTLYKDMNLESPHNPIHGETLKSHETHKAQAPQNLRCVVVTVSDTREEETDISGKLIKEYLVKNTHQVVAYHIVKDDIPEIQKLLRQEVANPEVQVIIFNGGTGIAPRDVTYEAVEKLLDKKIDGFGEIFRYLSYKEIGSAAILSRALAGVYNRKIVFSIPGSRGAVDLAMRNLILPEMGHMVWEANKEKLGDDVSVIASDSKAIS